MRIAATLFLALFILTIVARLRPPEYDEAYSIFVTAGDPRPAWPQGIFHPAEVRNFYSPASTPKKIAQDLRTSDVHPPLYFWILEFWRSLTGPSWFAARMLSVLFSIAALSVLAWLAALAEIPIVTTMLIAVLSYGFAYTGIIARGFALAQFLNILGMALTLKASASRKWIFGLAAGLAFGAAGFTNYLAIFVGLATLFWLLLDQPSRKQILPTAIGIASFLPPIAWFFIAQHNSRSGQFAAFSLTHAIRLLTKDDGASIFGGLPLYAGKTGNLVTVALAMFTLICAAFVIKNRQRKLFLFAIAATAPPAGLLALGLIFNNTPIEIRYLAFSTPFIALLLAQTLPRNLVFLLLAIEACGIAGLILAPATMQPQGIAAHQLSQFATPATLVLLPFGNDGVGIPGPFIASVPDKLRIELLKPSAQPNLTTETRIVLVTINIDAASRQTTANTLTMFNENPCWLEKSSTEFLKLFIQTCDHH